MFMFWWVSKIVLGVALITHSVMGHLGYIGHMPQPNSAVPLALIIVCGLTNLYHYYLIKSQNQDISRPANLCTDRGLYRYCRHPMYLCDLGLYLGLALYPVSSVSLILYGLSLYTIFSLAEDEDRKMAGLFSADFEIWKRNTGLLLPRLF